MADKEKQCGEGEAIKRNSITPKSYQKRKREKKKRNIRGGAKREYSSDRKGEKKEQRK